MTRLNILLNAGLLLAAAAIAGMVWWPWNRAPDAADILAGMEGRWECEDYAMWHMELEDSARADIRLENRMTYTLVIDAKGGATQKTQSDVMTARPAHFLSGRSAEKIWQGFGPESLDEALLFHPDAEQNGRFEVIPANRADQISVNWYLANSQDCENGRMEVKARDGSIRALESSTLNDQYTQACREMVEAGEVINTYGIDTRRLGSRRSFGLTEDPASEADPGMEEIRIICRRQE